LKRDNINYLAAGITVLIAFTLLFMVLFKITGRSGDTDDYHTYYSHVAGLRFGTPVYFEGYRVGQVEAVTPEITGSQTRFRIDLTVEQGWPIPIDSVAEITTSGLLSDVFIVLQQGTSAELFKSGSLIEGAEASDVFAAMNELAEELQHLTRTELAPLLELVNERVDTITADIQESTPIVLDSLEETVSKLNNAAGNLDRLMGDENIDHISSTLANFEQISVSARDLAEELRGTRKELDAAIIEVRSAVAENRPDLDDLVDNLAAAIENASTRLDHIGFNLDETSRNLNEFARAIRMSPNRLIFAQEDDAVEEQQ
jgi:phospholipid/cholesterol/gamma-HCH transport system substrate-binding protein